MHTDLVDSNPWSSAFGNHAPQKSSSQIHNFEWRSRLSRIRTDIPA
jgi:hypothetical protein